MPVKQPTELGLWWFKGIWKGQDFEGPVEYDGAVSLLDRIGLDDIFQLEDFVGEYWPLNHEVVTCGNEVVESELKGVVDMLMKMPQWAPGTGTLCNAIRKQ